MTDMTHEEVPANSEASMAVRYEMRVLLASPSRLTFTVLDEITERAEEHLAERFEMPEGVIIERGCTTYVRLCENCERVVSFADQLCQDCKSEDDTPIKDEQ